MRMGKIDFDIVKLKQIGDIDARNAIKNFASYEEYFNELNEFIDNSKNYLREYTPFMVMSYENVRKDFLAEIKNIKGKLMSLGVNYPLATLAELNYEAIGGNTETLSNWLNKFYTEIDKMAKSIASAKIAEEETNVVAPKNPAASNMDEKPLILAVDDKAELLTTVINMLEDRFRVMAATSGKAVMKLIEKHAPELFLLDIEMPQMDGYELMELIRKKENFKETPIIFLTGKNTRESVIEAIKNGGNDYILKPVSKDLLLNKILQHLGKI